MRLAFVAALACGVGWTCALEARAQTAPACTLTTAAGSPTSAAGDGGPALKAELYQPLGGAFDSKGNLYIADAGNNKIRRIDAQGAIAAVAGTGEPGFSGDGGPAATAALRFPTGVAIDSAGNVFFADTHNHRVRRIGSDGIINTVAGTGEAGFNGEQGDGPAVQLNFPMGLAFDGAGVLYIADFLNNRVRALAPSGFLKTYAGGAPPQFGTIGDGGPALSANVAAPAGLSFDNNGNLLIADSGNNRIRKVDARGVIATVAGSGADFFDLLPPPQGLPAIGYPLFEPQSAAMTPDGTLYIATPGVGQLLRVDRSGTLFPVLTALPTGPAALIAGPGGVLYFSDGSAQILRLDKGAQPAVVAGAPSFGFAGDGGPATLGRLHSPRGIAFDASGNLLIADEGNRRIRRLAPDGTLTTLAGTGSASSSGDGGPAARAALTPHSLAVAPDGSVYVVANERIRKIATDGVISAVFGGDPQQTFGTDLIAVDGDGNVFFTDLTLQGFRVIPAAGGAVQSFRFGEVAMLARDASGGMLASTSHGQLYALRADGSYLPVPHSTALGFLPAAAADPSSAVIYIAEPVYGTVLTERIYGIGRFTPDGALGKIAKVGFPLIDDGTLIGSPPIATVAGMALDASGDLYISDSANHRIRKISAPGRCAATYNPRLGSRLASNAASSLGTGFVSPGEIVTIDGINLELNGALGAEPDGRGFIGASLGGSRVLFNGIPAPILAAEAGEITAVVPYGAGEQPVAMMQVEIGGPSGSLTRPVALSAAPAVPGLYTRTGDGFGQAEALNENGSLNSPANPARRGSTVTLFATGLGPTNPPGVDGRIASGNPQDLPKPSLPVSVRIGGRDAAVLYAGATAGVLAGRMRVDIQTPASAAPGAAVEVELIVGGASTADLGQRVSIALK